MIEHKGYTGILEYDATIERFSGHVVDLNDTIYFEGESVGEVRESMARAVDHYLATCEKHDIDPERPFSGDLRVRMKSDLHRAVFIMASSTGVSLNRFIIETLAEKVADPNG